MCIMQADKELEEKKKLKELKKKELDELNSLLRPVQSLKKGKCAVQTEHVFCAIFKER